MWINEQKKKRKQHDSTISRYRQIMLPLFYMNINIQKRHLNTNSQCISFFNNLPFSSWLYFVFNCYHENTDIAYIVHGLQVKLEPLQLNEIIFKYFIHFDI